MITMNNKMMEIVTNQETSNNFPTLAVQNFCYNIISNTVLRDNFIVYSNEQELDKIDLKLALQNFYDMTDLEMFYNELIIPLKLIKKSSIIAIMNTFKNELLRKYPNIKFCVIIYWDDKFVLRFHRYRETEGIWLSENLEECNNPIMYDV